MSCEGSFPVTLQYLKQTCSKWLKVKYVSGRERGCLFEEHLVGPGGKMLPELQVWVVGKQPLFLRYDHELSQTTATSGVVFRNNATLQTHATYFTVEGEIIPGLEIVYDFDITPPEIHAAAQCGQRNGIRQLPLNKKTLEVLLQFAATVAERVNSRFFRLDLYMRSKGTLVFGECTMTPMACRDMYVPVILDAVLGKAIWKQIKSSVLRRIVSSSICDQPSPYIQPSPYMRNNLGKKRTKPRNDFKDFKDSKFRALLFRHDIQRLTREFENL